MVRIRTSRAGDISFRGVAGQTGFTLLELLVVLAIIGGIGLLIPGFLFRDGSSLALDRATRALAEGLRDVRGQAVSENGETLFVVDVERGQFRPGLAATPVQVAGGITLKLVTARTERSSEAVGQIRFFPDGSSTGGRILLADDERELAIEVDWLTGDISMADDVR